MSEDLRNMDDLFRKALEENQELPSGTVWDNIDKTLDKKKVVSISKKYNKLKWAAAALLLFSLGMAMYTLHITQQNKQLVQQNRAVRNIGNEKIKNLSSSKDSSNASAINQTPPQLRDKLENQKKNNDSAIKNNNVEATANSGVVNKTGNDQQNAINNHQKIEQPKTKTDDVALNNQIHPRLRNAAGFKMKVKKEISDSPDNITNNDTRNLFNDKNKSNLSGAKTNSDIIATNKQKNIETSELTPEIKTDLPLSTQKQDIQIDKISQQRLIALNNRKLSSAKRSKINSSVRSLFSITGFFSPDIVSTSLKDDHPRFREEESNEIVKNEQIKFSSTVGLLLDYNIGKKWKLESGLTYSSRKTVIHPKTIYARPDDDGNINYRFNCSAGYSYVTVNSSPSPAFGDSISALTSTNNLQYIGVPFNTNYIFSTGRFTLLPAAGISFNFLTKGQIETTIASATGSKNSSSNKVQGLKSMYMNGMAGIGLQYSLGKTISLSFEPAYRFAISSINKDASIKTDLNSLGLSTGLVFKL